MRAAQLAALVHQVVVLRLEQLVALLQGAELQVRFHQRFVAELLRFAGASQQVDFGLLVLQSLGARGQFSGAQLLGERLLLLLAALLQLVQLLQLLLRAVEDGHKADGQNQHGQADEEAAATGARQALRGHHASGHPETGDARELGIRAVVARSDGSWLKASAEVCVLFAGERLKRLEAGVFAAVATVRYAGTSTPSIRCSCMPVVCMCVCVIAPRLITPATGFTRKQGGNQFKIFRSRI